LEFNGIVYDETKTREYWEKKSDGLPKITLRQCCAFLGLDPSGNKSEIATRLLDFLEKPKDTGETFDIPNDPSKKRKTASRGRSRSRSRSKSPSRKKQKTDKRKTKKKKRILMHQRDQFLPSFAIHKNTEMRLRRKILIGR